MCGIAGLVSHSGASLNLSEFKEMVDIQSHRGPDDFGFAVWGKSHDEQGLPKEKSVFFVDEINLALGHRRLSILDLSPAGRQPMSSREGRYWITYNGEVYNYRELASELKNHGFEFKTGTDTEVILAAYDKWGPDCLNKFNGMWALAVYDQKEKSLFLARDRFGVKPLYYAFDNEFFGFASEIKGLLGAGFGTGKAQRQNVAQFLLYGDVNNSESTCFEGIQELRPGYFVNWNIRDGVKAFRPRRYFTLPELGAVDANEDIPVLKDEVMNLISDSVKLRLRSDVEVGSCLSGGLDSSLIVKTAADQLGGTKSLKTFTSCFPGTDVDEWYYADMVNKSAQAKAHQVFPKLGNLFDDLDTLIWHQEEPFRSSSIYAQWSVMQEAHKQGIKVLLDGQGADEVMAGYHFFIPMYLAALAKKLMWKKLGKEVADLNKTGILMALDNVPKVFLKSLYWGIHGHRLRRPALGRLMRSDIQTDRDVEFPKDINQALGQELELSLPSLLRHEDRNSMAFSIEARTPYLDYRLVELFLKMSITSKIRNGWTKPFLREIMDSKLPKELVWRTQKLGFATPEKTWYQENVKRIKDELFGAEFRLDPWFDKKNLELSWMLLPSDRVWRIFCANRWMKRFSLS